MVLFGNRRWIYPDTTKVERARTVTISYTRVAPHTTVRHEELRKPRLPQLNPPSVLWSEPTSDEGQVILPARTNALLIQSNCEQWLVTQVAGRTPAAQETTQMPLIPHTRTVDAVCVHCRARYRARDKCNEYD